MKYPYEHLKDLKYKEEQVNLFNKWVINNKIAKQIYKGNYWTNLLPGSKRHMQKDARNWGYYPKIDRNAPYRDDHSLMFEDFHGDRIYVRNWAYYPKIDGNAPYRDDHSLMFEDFHGDRIYVYQPYPHDVFWKDEENIKKWAENKGISAIVFNKEYSWYFFNRTLLVELRIENKEKFKKYLRLEYKREEDEDFEQEAIFYNNL